MEGCSPQSIDTEISRKRQRLSTPSTTIRESEPARPFRELGHMRAGSATGAPSFVGSGSGIHFVRTVRSAFARNSRQGSEVFDDGIVPGEDDRLQSQNPPSSLWRTDEVDDTFQNRTNTSPATFEDMIRWSQPYFINWHPPFPFLHAPTILNLMEMISQNGMRNLGSTELIMIRSIMSISVADRRQMPKDNGSKIPSRFIFTTIEEAISCLEKLLIRPSTLPGLQAVVCIQVFLISMFRLNAASRLGGLIVRMAFHLGLHRCPVRYEQFSTADSDMRRRLFWCIYCIERYLSQSLGLPLDLRDDDIDVCYPSRELHSDAVEASMMDHRMLLPEFLAKHGHLKGLILELRNKSISHRSTDPDKVAHVDSEIMKWWNEAQDLLDPSYMDEDLTSNETSLISGTLRPVHKLLLVVQNHESVILLNRPVITSGHNTSAFAGAMQKCIGASKAIISRVYRHLYDALRYNADGRTQNPLFWPGFTWCVWMSGLILLYAAFEGYYSAKNAQREARRCVQILENLSLRGNFWPGACAAAIKDLMHALNQKTIKGANDNQDVQELGSIGPRTDSCADVTSASFNSPAKGAGKSGDSMETNNTHIRSNGGISDSIEAPETRSSLAPENSFGCSPTAEISSLPITSALENSSDESAGTSQSFFGFDSDYHHLFQNSNPQYPLANGQFDGFDDIFQLMDASYQFNEHMYEGHNGTGPATGNM